MKNVSFFEWYNNFWIAEKCNRLSSRTSYAIFSWRNLIPHEQLLYFKLTEWGQWQQMHWRASGLELKPTKVVQLEKGLNKSDLDWTNYIFVAERERKISFVRFMSTGKMKKKKITDGVFLHIFWSHNSRQLLRENKPFFLYSRAL